MRHDMACSPWQQLAGQPERHWRSSHRLIRYLPWPTCVIRRAEPMLGDASRTPRARAHEHRRIPRARERVHDPTRVCRRADVRYGRDDRAAQCDRLERRDAVARREPRRRRARRTSSTSRCAQPRDRIYYPDGVVVCSPHAGDTLVFDDPCLILEVTSRSTRRIDRGEKLDAYLAIPSLRAYIIAEQDRRHVTLYSRELGGAWNREEVVSSGAMMLPCPATVLTLDEVYEGIELPPATVRENDDWEEA